MSPVALSALLALYAVNAAAQATGTFPAVPLASKHFAYPGGIPYQADTDPNLIRGNQFGFNICNSTTENQNSLCQTSFVNHIDDFCLWAPSEPNSVIANTEGEEVAWCTKPGHGTRLIPEGTLTGVQYIRTPDYIQIVGFIKQTNINIQDGDFGGELDPHGADLRGNPLGGLMYSNAFGGGNDNNTYTQVIEWTNFMGGNAFCIKVCDPAGPNAAHYCEHIYDRIGCAYNAPNAAQDGTFEVCQGENMDFPGVYTSNGAVVTYTQPPESLGPITTMPYTARVPASSNCVPYQSGQLYAALASVSAPGSTPTTSGSGTGTASGGSASATGTSRGATSGGASGTGTGTAAGANATGNSANAGVVALSGAVTVMGVVFSALFLS